jgi:hypothetical protein
VNEKKVVHFQDTKLQGGKLALTLASGTNKDFGTRCIMKSGTLGITGIVENVHGLVIIIPTEQSGFFYANHFYL